MERKTSNDPTELFVASPPFSTGEWAPSIRKTGETEKTGKTGETMYP